MTTPKTLLVVEDNTITREGLGVILRRAGYEVVLAANGEEALVLLRSLRIDLILLDMLMPVVDGWHFLQRFSTEADLLVPVIVMTSSILTHEWAEDNGCCGFIRKPIDPDSMLKEIRRCLKKKSKRPGSDPDTVTSDPETESQDLRG